MHMFFRFILKFKFLLDRFHLDRGIRRHGTPHNEINLISLFEVFGNELSNWEILLFH